jgi:hypothetical protein
MIKPLRAETSHEYYELPTKILQLSAPFIMSPWTYICKQSLSSGVFPDRLKFSIVKPIFKNGDKFITSNYTRISLLTAFLRYVKNLHMLDHMNI